MNTKKIIHVAIAILNQQGKTLIAWRDEHLHQGGQYEFAGGKVEQGETPMQACRREVLEEVGIDIEHWCYFDEIVHQYDDRTVHLHVFQASVPFDLNHQIVPRWQWVYRDELANFQFPSANQSIIQRLMWRPYIKISADFADIEQLNTRTQFYWRCFEQLNVTQAVEQLNIVAQQNPQLLAQCIINQTIYQQCSIDVQKMIKAIHLTEQQLLAQTQLDDDKSYIASCHSLASLKWAEQIGCDAVFYSPVQKTTTHPDVKPLGWEIFEQSANNSLCMIFALGGLQPNDLSRVRECGGFGVAGIRAF
ncbi:NUDIX domain-containing protein [Moraxella sp. ZY210820]|uniref:NUDIX domain-containing protein n=1 Tax=unclassified Moraxella TaxID=2685852 RepID=UPI00272F9966|nr:NUDIX domain-containing protein [Moraxella sp. ZY210820]